MEQLAPHVSAQGQAAVPQKGQHLAVDAHPRPAQHEGRHGQPAGQGPVGEGGHPRGQLHQSGEQPLGPKGGQAQGGEQGGQAAGQGGQHPGIGEDAQKDGEEQHEGADVQQRLEGTGHRPGEGPGEGDRLELGTARPAGEGALVRLVEPEDHSHQQGGQQMGQIEEQPRRPAAEHPRPHRPQDEGGAAVVAEGQEPLRLGAGALAALVELDGGAGPHRIAPHRPQGQGGGAGPVHPEQRGHDGFQQPAQVPGQPQLHHQGGQHKEGE